MIMKKWEKIKITKHVSLMETMEIIDSSSLQFAVVVDENNCLIGTVTDGDIRRGILQGISLNEKIKEVMNSSPIIFLFLSGSLTPLSFPKNLS